MALDGVHVPRPAGDTDCQEPRAQTTGSRAERFAAPHDVDGASWQISYTHQPRSIKRAWGWTSRTTTLDAFCLDCLEHHEERYAKDGACFVPGRILGEARNKNAVAELHALGFDVDRSSWSEVTAVLAKIQAAGLFCIVYSTHNHESRETEIEYDSYQSFCITQGLNAESSEAASRYLFEVKRYPQNVVAAARLIEMARDTEAGVMAVLGHEPMVKLRLLFVLDRPYKITEWLQKGFSQEDARGRLWTAVLETFAREFGLSYDTACRDVSRAYYAASCKPGMTATAIVKRLEGKAVRLDSLVPLSPVALEAIVPPKGAAKPKSSSTRINPPSDAKKNSFQGFNLEAWAAQYAKTFNIEGVFKARELVLEARPAGGCYVQCFQESAHTSPNPPRTYVVNGAADKGFVLSCSGSTNGCCDLDRLELLVGYLESGRVGMADLQKAEYGGGSISARVYHESKRNRRHHDLRVVDSDGRGIDIAIFHATIIAQPGRFDFGRLNALCGTQIESDVSAEQLAVFVEAGRITIDQLVKCWCARPTLQRDVYAGRLEALAIKRGTGAILGREFDGELAEIASLFNAKMKTIEADYRKIEAALPSVPGMLSPEDAALVQPMRDYIRDYAVVNTGGKGVVLNLRQPDLSKAIMPRDDFEFLHREDWFETASKDGTVRTVYPAKEFLIKPPRGTQVYHGGLVFKPSGTVAADEYNLYRGMLIEPNESGSCELFKDLIRDVWVQGDEATYQWVLEWLMHIIAYPGEKVSTSIAIRGDYGDGKSIVTEKLMRSILGDMLLRVANQKLILGDFNEAAIGKLLITLEEAAFAGDKAAFDRLKEQITGEKVVINPKFKAPVVVDNYARMMVVSNHPHFLHLKPGDRRYTVLESSPSWKGSFKFEELMALWARGGAARFVYEALTHSFRKFDDRQTLTINTNLKTKAAVRQMAHSRSPLEKCIVSLLLRGDFKSWKTGDVLVLSALGCAPGASLWPLDAQLQMQSQALEVSVAHWLRDFGGQAGQYEATLHTIIETLEKFAGKTEDKRPKGRLDTGTRSQLPTLRILPRRRDAIEHARGQGLITEEEYQGALPVDGEK
jgi:hypothetical protein